jgi:tRNA (guanine-N7-)-methyltransferase
MTSTAPGAFFGRRKGKRLRAGQESLLATLLPGLRLPAEGPVDLAALFPEPFVNGLAKLLAVIEREGLANIRLWDRDATELLPHLPSGSLDTVYLLYPDPWPKRRQRKRRLLSDETLAALARVLRPGGELRFATDIDDYAGWALARALRSPDLAWTAERPDDWRRPWPGWPGTRYEAKALSQGRRPSYLTFRRVSNGARNVPLTA